MEICLFMFKVVADFLLNIFKWLNKKKRYCLLAYLINVLLHLSEGIGLLECLNQKANCFRCSYCSVVTKSLFLILQTIIKQL